MQVIEDRDELRAELADWRQAGEHVALVPTMGNLHAGHVELVAAAREHAERVVVSVFVNPTQFGAGEDFSDYPRTLERDTRRLKKATADILFTPSVETMYPFGLEEATRVVVPYLTDQFCGASRPGHFEGVTTVVARLFALVQPDTAVFGQKDYQQQLIVRRMVEDLSLPIAIITVPTVREDDGLALSSRNGYLTDDERERAPGLYATLSAVGAELQAGKRDFAALEEQARAALATAGFQPEYVAVRRALDLSVPDRDCDEIVVMAAVRLGKARLIDNVVVTI
ncbi:MAG: pantoate--beta-alanine ligase [Woeseiaceae bacterium]|nr:pantoate--beta-alanine ligase [Woeseiaceae bacterium]